MADRLAELLVSEGAVAAADLERALVRQRQAGGALDTALLELGLIDEERLTEALAAAARLPQAPEQAWKAADPRSRRVFPSKVAERHGLVPFALDGRELSLVAAYPVDASLLDELGFMLSLHLQPHVAPEWRVRQLVQRLYGTPLSERLAVLAERLSGQSETVAPPPAVTVQANGSASLPVQEGTRRYEQSETLEPLAAALAQAMESDELAQLTEEAKGQSRATDPNAPPHWSLGQARAALAAAKERDELVTATLRYVRDFFEYAACFAVTFDAVAGHDALSSTDEAARDQCRMSAVSLSEPGLFRPVLDARAPYLGPPPRDAGSEAMLRMLGREAPRTVLLYPVSLRGRLLCIYFADNGEAPVSPQRLSDLLIVLATVGSAFERILRERKRGQAARRSPRPRYEPELWQTREPARMEESEPFDLDVDLGDYEVATVAEAFALPRAFDPAAAVLDLERSGRGSTERGRLIALLVQHAAESVPYLCSRFPGPLEVKSEALAEATPIYEQGPILAALAALGTVSTPYLVPLLADASPQGRRCALRLLGHLADPAGFQALAERVFDSDPRVVAAARDQLEALRFHGEMTPVAERLRGELMSPHIDRAARAALALGALRDTAAVPLLIERLSAERSVAEAAADALWRITLRRQSASSTWGSWWQEHRSSPRSAWLFAGLVSEEREVRLSAAAELASVGTPPVAYSADAPQAEREEAARAWGSWWENAGLSI